MNFKGFENLSREQLIKILMKLQKEGKVDVKELVKEEGLIPIEIFKNDWLSSLETVCKFLKENKGMKYHEIAVLLNRDDRTIWTTYNNSLKKMPERFKDIDGRINLPISILSNRRLSPLKSVVVYLKDNYGMRYHEIAVLLNRDDRTIWTTYNRTKKK